MSTSSPTTPDHLPTRLSDYLVAHAARDVDAALRAFAPTATVTDEGRTFRGTEEVRRFLGSAGAGWTWTTEVLGAERLDDRRWVVTTRIEGDFPGGTAELDHRFVLVDDLVTDLVITPR